MFRGVAKEPGKRGSLAGLLLGLALFAVAHVFVCALHAPDGHRGPVSVRESGAVGRSVDIDRCGETRASDHRAPEADGGCCGPMAHLCDGPARVEPLSSWMMLLGLPVLGAAGLNACSGPARSGIRPAMASPPRRGAEVLQMACVSRM
ncbi:hypothetical protein [Streptomyces sp. NPDC005970]|uniref:hypothetical protein n=1 Tax=Streptomyces sp. NPDC005970 TaxID=3156723 RepID=UPI0033F79930